jgi:hypothetical protein
MAKDKRQSPSTLLWFIRHKSYVPISEIRRRFFVDTEDGCFIEVGNHKRAYVGLPPGTAQSLEKLWQQGKIGFELSAEFDADVLIGVYPMVPSKEHMNGSGFAYANGNGNGHYPAPQRIDAPDEPEPASQEIS